jgi:radical SAM superfamily enzyme YgiQ (UPF0313 family)
MKKILFISAPRWNEVSYPVQDAMGGMAVFPPIGMLYISSYLKKQLGDAVDSRLFDYNLVDAGDLGAIDSLLDDFQPDIVGLTTYTFILYDIYRICRYIRAKLPQAKIVLGGKQTEIYPHEALEQEFVDYVVVGEGEKPMLELVQALDSGNETPQIPGVWFRSGGKIHDSGRAERLADLDNMPFPDLSIIDPDDYSYKFGSGVPEAIMVSSRGCPMRCRYCMSSHFDKKFVTRSAKNVVEEIEQWVEAGYRVINFFDDNFNANIKRAKQICRLLIERDLPITWTMRGSANQIDAEFADLLASSGCERAILGIESANEHILAAFDRKSDNKKIRLAFKLLDAAGVSTAGYFMLGFPGEDLTLAQNTIDFAKSLPLDYAQFVVLFPAPGSPFFFDLLKDGKMKDIYQPFSLAPPEKFALPYYEDLLTTKEVGELCKSAYRQFYFRPTLILRHLKKLKSPTELYRKSQLAYNLAKFSLLNLLRGNG